MKEGPWEQRDVRSDEKKLCLCPPVVQFSVQLPAIDHDINNAASTQFSPHIIIYRALCMEMESHNTVLKFN